MPFVILPTNSASGGYDITNSLRFNSGSSDYLNRTFSSGNQGLWTFSCWFKISALSADQVIFGRQVDGSNIGYIGLRSDNKLEVINKISTVGVQFTTDAVYRDVSAWYHLVVAFDGSQATQSNRLKLYINGVVQSGSYDAVLGTGSGLINANTSHAIGRRETLNNNYFSGYITEAYFINAQQLTPSSFGETDEDTGIWKPKAYTGTYGTNGFYLKFANSASLGTDSSGNGNNFTVNNLTSVDQSTDTPTNNFATLNPLDNRLDSGSGILYPNTLTQGNLNASPTDVTTAGVSNSTIAINGGSFFAEFKVLGISGIMDIGILAKDNWSGSAYPFSTANVGYSYRNSGDKRSSAGVVAYGASYTTNDIIGVAFDNTNGNLTFYKNGTSQGVAFTGLTSNLNFVFSYAGVSGNNISVNFGSPPYAANSYTDANGFGNFSYQVPAGFYSLNTKNLATFG